MNTVISQTDQIATRGDRYLAALSYSQSAMTFYNTKMRNLNENNSLN
jgi:hypothetical protein